MIFVGIGSNLNSSFGDRFKNINFALSFLESYQINIIKKSNFYETPSYPNNKDPKFINIAASISTTLPPVDLVSVLLFIEEKLERKRNFKNEPRTCDIDLLDYNGQVIDFKYNNLDFTVPHKELSQRNFVLFPLKEICPQWLHPKTRKNIDELIDALSDDDKKSILKVRYT
tara:strand:- start:1647 stop:2159 length:513 start_codon:yes stop_codon:yes gene_type:complete